MLIERISQFKSSLCRLLGRGSSKGGACISARRSLSNGVHERKFASIGLQTETTSRTDHFRVLDKIDEKFQDITLSEKDKSLYRDVKIKVWKEIYKLQYFGQLRVMLESGDDVDIEIGEREGRILFYNKDGKTVLESSALQVSEFTSTNPSLESSDVRNATVHLFLDEKDTELVDFTEKAVCDGILGLPFKNTTFTITFENRKCVEITHGNGRRKLNVKHVDGKPVCIWENGIVSLFTRVYANLPTFPTFINNFQAVISTCNAIVQFYFLVYPRPQVQT